MPIHTKILLMRGPIQPFLDLWTLVTHIAQFAECHMAQLDKYLGKFVNRYLKFCCSDLFGFSTHAIFIDFFFTFIFFNNNKFEFIFRRKVLEYFLGRRINIII